MAKHGFTYDVFLSFSDEDTDHRFIGHLRNGLSRKGIKSFYKDLTTGEGIAPSLSNAIEESQILIIVFSENYASSTRCVDELVKILECTKNKRDKKQRVFPIFYHVDPSDVRKQKKSYARAQASSSYLIEASNFPGQEINRTGYEAKLIEEIVEKICKYIAPKPLHAGQNPVGLEPRIEEVKSLLDMKPDDTTVRMLGIWGLGGVGKTELAKALYDNIVQHFDAASFLADVREKSNQINGLKDLQKALLSEMLKELETDLDNTSKGMSDIQRRLHQKKVLLFLDDVDDKDSLEKLAGGCDWFGSGSRIIITTRDKDVLIAHQVEMIYEMKELDEQHSLELFCWNAFKQSNPKIGFEDVSLRVVDFAKRLPFALKVLGSELATLHEESPDAWERALEEYERSPPNEKIYDMLKISYNRLKDYAKQVFLDIACFFKGEKIEYVKKILEEFGTTSNINVLVNRSLLTIEDGCLKMHDLIQDMGREIVRQEAPNYPGERSRLWDYDDVIEILTGDSGSDKIQGILLDPPQREEVYWSGTAFDKMKWLRILIVRNTTFSCEPEHLSNHLRVLDWEEYPSKSFPSRFHPKKIIVFNLPRSLLTLEEPFKKFSCLTSMDFSNNQSITEIPDVSQVQNLRQLRLDHCRNLVVVHESVGRLERLAHLSVSECTKLRNFLREMLLPSLEVLDLNFCVSLEHFPEIMEEMKKPLKIYMINTAIQELPESIGNLTGLVSIEISCSRRLKYIPACIKKCDHLTSLDANHCMELQKIPECTNLKILDVHGCYNLQEISELPSTIQKVDARYCSNLTRETSDMLWFQLKKGTEVVMPFKPEIPQWFDLGNRGNPHFWARGKFPNIALAMVFQFGNECEKEKLARRQLVDLHLLINGRYVPCKGHYNFRVAADHVLIGDLRVLFSDKEWFGLDAFLGEQQWNLVQVSYEATSTVTLSRWGAFVYEEGTNMEDVQFTCPDPMYSKELLLLSPTIVPMKDPKEEDKKMIVNLGLDEVFEKMFMETMRYKEREDFVIEEMHILMGGLKELSTQAKDALESKGSALEDPNSYLRWVLDTIKNDDGEPKILINKDLALIRLKNPVKVPMDVGNGNSEKDPREEIMKELEIFYEGMADGLLEAQNSFSSLYIIGTNSAALNKGNRVAPPGSHDPLLQALVMILKQESLVSEAKSKLFWKLREEHEALRNKFVQLRNAAPDKDSDDTATSWKNQYDELIKKFNTQSDEFVSKKLEYGTKSASSSTGMHTDTGCKCVTKYEKVGAVLKGRAEELGRLYDDGIKGLQNSEEFLDLMSAIYFNGLCDGLLEVQAILLASRPSV